MNSFYGGKQGRTYHIVERYDCISTTDFKNAYQKERQKEEQGYTIKDYTSNNTIPTIKKG